LIEDEIVHNRFVDRAFVVGFALITACSSIPAVPGPTVSSDGRSWSSNGLPVHTKLSATQDSIVYGGIEADRLYVVALDPATGVERWRRLSDVSGRVQGVEQSILADDDTAYFLAGSEPSGWTSILVAVTTATGQERWRRDLDLAYVDPNVFACGDSICIDAMTASQEIWKLSKSDGRFVSKTAVSKRGYAVTLYAHSDPALLTVSRPELGGEARIVGFEQLGETKVWTRYASELFADPSVNPDRGWNSLRVDDGWVVWLGRGDDPSTYGPGDVVPAGVVAGFDDRGRSRWIAEGHHMCWMIESQATAVLCDGRSHVISAENWELKPNSAEGRDPTSGAVRWRLELGGEIDDTNANARVVRVDENRYLLDLSRGLVLLDIERGPEPAPNGLMAGWCRSEQMPERILRRGVIGGQIFARARHAFPCRLGGGATEPVVPIPAFAGVNVAGWGAWVENGQVHAKRESD
jgi:hypothetical protein